MAKNTGKRNRQRGADFEREATKALHALGYRTARKTGSIQANGQGDPDIAGIPGVWVSCKRWRVMRWLAWWRDADQRCPHGSVPLIIHRPDRGEIYVSFRLKDTMQILEGLEDSAAASRLLHP